MQSLFVITKIDHPKLVVGISANNAVEAVRGPAIFAFNKLPVAMQFARAADMYLDERKIFISDDIFYPISKHTIGRTVKLVKHPHNHCSQIGYNIQRDDDFTSFNNVKIEKIKKSHIENKIASLHGSVIVLDKRTNRDDLFVSGILSPQRTIQKTVYFLEDMYKL